MSAFYISKQKIRDTKKYVYAYEIVFKDSSNRPVGFLNSLKATSQLILKSIGGSELKNLLGAKAKAFINVDETTLTKNILDVLDKERFILNILEDIIKTIIAYKKKGFLFFLEHFDSSARMIVKFQRLFNYIDIIKMDILISETENMKKVMQKFKNTRIKLLAQGVDTKEDFEECIEMGFDYFQGSFIDKPEVLPIEDTKEPAPIIVLELIRIIKNNKSTEELEYFIKQQADLSFKLIEFFNNMEKLDIQVESLTQVITLLGRNKLLRWLLVYLYFESSADGASKTILDLAIRRAELMEEEADEKNKDKAYLAGMFSMLGSIFEMDIKELMNYVKMDSDITMLVLHKKGIFASSLMYAEMAEKKYLKKVMMANFEKLSTADLVYTLEDSGVDINKNDI